MNKLTTSIDELKLPDTILSRLRAVGLRTVGGLCVLTFSDLLHLGLSVSEVLTVQSALDKLGMELSSDALVSAREEPATAPARSNEDRFADALEQLATAVDRIVGLMEKTEARQAEMMALLSNPAALMAKVRSAMEAADASPISESSRPNINGTGAPHLYPRPVFSDRDL
jgi:hypothetical protein